MGVRRLDPKSKLITERHRDDLRVGVTTSGSWEVQFGPVVPSGVRNLKGRVAYLVYF